jgi:hypothetical protein
MKKFVQFILIVSLFIFECKKVFLDETIISSLTYPEFRHNLVIYFDKSIIVDEDGGLNLKTHSLLKIGGDLKTAPDLFYVFDGSVENLIDFQAKIIHPDGSSKTYHKNDLLFQSLS